MKEQYKKLRQLQEQNEKGTCIHWYLMGILTGIVLMMLGLTAIYYTI